MNDDNEKTLADELAVDDLDDNISLDDLPV